jgi:hypothetical protein
LLARREYGSVTPLPLLLHPFPVDARARVEDLYSRLLQARAELDKEVV